MILGEHVTLDAGTGAVHTARRTARKTSPSASATACPWPIRWAPTAASCASTPLVAGLKVEEANRSSSRRCASAARCCTTRPIRTAIRTAGGTRSPLIFRATPQWFISMDQQGLRAHALRDIKTVQWTPGLGRAAHHRHDRESPGLVYFAPAHLGRADRRCSCTRDGELHPRTQELIEAVAARVEQGGIDAWFALDPARAAGRRGRRLRKAHGRHGRLGRLGPVVRVRRRRRARTSTRRWICTWKARTSTAAGSTARC